MTTLSGWRNIFRPRWWVPALFAGAICFGGVAGCWHHHDDDDDRNHRDRDFDHHDDHHYHDGDRDRY